MPTPSAQPSSFLVPSTVSRTLAASAIAIGALLAATPSSAVPVSVVGTNDLHGQVEQVAALSGHLKVLRAANTKAGGGVVLVDGGDMFQGTLASNLKEGEAVVAAYNAVGYDAVCIGNHEFDFGPTGPDAISKNGGDDPRGALKARAAEAKFPFLAANIENASGGLVDWPNVKPSFVKKVGKAGVPVGFIGLSTTMTPRTTILSNVKDLRFTDLAKAVEREAKALRKQGAVLIVVAAHAGGKCTDLVHENNLNSCEADAEIMGVARAIPKGTVDVIVAGHTHQTMAHDVNGIAIVESWANGRGFGRVDFDVKGGKATRTKIHPPRELCGKGQKGDDISKCKPEAYEGKPVVVDTALLKTLSPWLKGAKDLKAQKLGVTVKKEIRRGYDEESELGNLFADLMLEAHPKADIVLMNGGGIRANLRKGALTYGDVFEMMPFDNRYATAQMRVSEVRRVLEKNMSRYKKGGIYSTAGLTIENVCNEKGHAQVTLSKGGKVLPDDQTITVLTTDFVALGGDGGLAIAENRVTVDEGLPVRESLVERFKARQGVLQGGKALYDPKAPRLATKGQSKARCQ